MKAEVRISKLEGKGVFALKSIKRNEKIFRFSNNLIYINHKPGCHCKICCRCINLHENYWLYPKDSPLGWSLNHSCNANAYIKGREIFALKNIKKNEETTIDYSTTNVDEKWKMYCHCKTKKCRKIIRSIQFLPRRLFKKFKGKMPKFIERNYKEV